MSVCFPSTSSILATMVTVLLLPAVAFPMRVLPENMPTMVSLGAIAVKVGFLLSERMGEGVLIIWSP